MLPDDNRALWWRKMTTPPPCPNCKAGNPVLAPEKHYYFRLTNNIDRLDTLRDNKLKMELNNNEEELELLKIYSKLTKAQYTLSYFSLRSWTWKNANVIDLWTRLLKIYSKLTKAQYTLSYFSLRSWTWKNANVIDLWTRLSDKDQELFFFDVAQLDWDHYCKALLLGLRVYLVKDGIHTLPAARRKWQR
ncbi:fatty acyl-CoA reductase 2-like [Diaphorina citri]|uniref:Fatty acyl-CoA reductase 2-like n=1 Tax=Diaphorina citri TaxID=121845 RepID=A0A3Q0JDM3_DIACI|nr:fatty acyl-CoA reductase 2-like [Diaphorina citri]